MVFYESIHFRKNYSFSFWLSKTMFFYGLKKNQLCLYWFPFSFLEIVYLQFLPFLLPCLMVYYSFQRTSSWSVLCVTGARLSRRVKRRNKKPDFAWKSILVGGGTANTLEAEAGGPLSLRPAWSTEWVPEQPMLHRETLSWKNKTKHPKSILM